MGFFIETMLGGLMTGMLYSLVALGFVLIFKASGVFNFAQGAMVLVAALAMARFSEWSNAALGGDSLFLANVIGIIGAGAVMFLVAWAVERFVLRKLVNQEGATLLMVTLGIAYVLEGLGQTFFGSEIYSINVGMPKDPVIMFEGLIEGGVMINKEDFIAAALAAVLVGGLTVFFQKTAIGRALRAVADDHQAAQSVGIPLNKTWVIVWCVAGLVALVAGIIWGSKMGVQFSLVTVALRALPVVILGGLTSVPGAIVGGLIIGVGEKLSEVYLGPFVGGGIEIWFAYVMALIVLLFTSVLGLHYTSLSWLMMGLAALTTFATFFYGGGYMICAVWLVFLGLSLYVHGLFSEELLEWAGLLTMLIGISSLFAKLPFETMRWVAAAVFGIGLPLLALLASVPLPPMARPAHAGTGAALVPVVTPYRRVAS